jgi:hypothetical protein
MDTKADADFNRALDFLHLVYQGMGGGIVALAHDHGETHTLFTVEGDAPTALDDGPCDVGTYDNETWAQFGTLRQYPTLAAALLELYGPNDTDPLPEALAPCRAIVEG